MDLDPAGDHVGVTRGGDCSVKEFGANKTDTFPSSTYKDSPATSETPDQFHLFTSYSIAFALLQCNMLMPRAAEANFVVMDDPGVG